MYKFTVKSIWNWNVYHNIIYRYTIVEEKKECPFTLMILVTGFPVKYYTFWHHIFMDRRVQISEYRTNIWHTTQTNKNDIPHGKDYKIYRHLLH